jgi:hypothetical protein
MKDQNLDDSNELDPEDDLRMDNKIKRLELELKGAKFMEHNPEGIQLPPEIEGQMLDQILAFEKMKTNAVEIEIYEFLGKPRYKKIEKLTSEEIIIELERVLKVMAKKGVMLDSIVEVDDAVFYRFITEEFFFKKMLDMPIKGFIRHFIYEEFHPNEQLNAEKTAEFFIQAYMNEEDDLPIKLLCREEIHEYLYNFKSLYSHFKLHNLETIYSDIKKIVGLVCINIEFEAFIENSLKSHILKGEIAIQMKKRKGFWQVSYLEFPKLA